MHQIRKCTKKIFKLLQLNFLGSTQLCTVCSYGIKYSKHQTLTNAKYWCDICLLSYTNDL